MMALRVRLILGADSDLSNELITTTESATSRGGRTYHPQQRDQDHNTDALRCVSLAIRDLNRDESIPDLNRFGGWSLGGFGGAEAGVSWAPPWSSPA